MEEPQNLAELLRELGKSCDVILLAQPGLRDKSARFVGSEHQPLRDVLDQLGALFSAHWYQLEGRYVLARDIRLVPLSAITHEQADEIIGRTTIGIFDQLTPEQWTRLEGRQRLRFDDLTPEQQSLAREYAGGARARALTMERALTPSHRDIQIQLTPPPADGGEREVLIELFGSYGLIGGVYTPLSLRGRPR